MPAWAGEKECAQVCCPARELCLTLFVLLLSWCHILGTFWAIAWHLEEGNLLLCLGGACNAWIACRCLMG